MKTTAIKLFALSAMTVFALQAQADHHQSANHGHPQKDDASAAKGKEMPPTATRGEVRAINKEKQRITLKHEAIKHLNMAGMTMPFRVADPAMLDQVKVGDQVEFKAVQEQGMTTLIELRVLK